MESKPMKLKFVKSAENTWDKIIVDLESNNIIFSQNGLLLLDEMNKEYFDGWENQIKQIPNFNIVEVERFI